MLSSKLALIFALISAAFNPELVPVNTDLHGFSDNFNNKLSWENGSFIMDDGHFGIRNEMFCLIEISIVHDLKTDDAKEMETDRQVNKTIDLIEEDVCELLSFYNTTKKEEKESSSPRFSLNLVYEDVYVIAFECYFVTIIFLVCSSLLQFISGIITMVKLVEYCKQFIPRKQPIVYVDDLQDGRYRQPTIDHFLVRV